MPTKKALRIYKLYDGPHGPTEKSVYYGQITKTLYHVAAANVKQAILLAAKRIWSSGGGPGLVEIGDDEGWWQLADGTKSRAQSYFHGKRFTT